jgi:DNA polymerase-4
MDAFFASCELRTRPELKGRPVVVGVEGGRGVVLAATYEARRFGVHSAMPMSRARRLCPQAIVLAPTHGLYSQVSAGVMAVFADITPLVEPLSLDEAFLDVAGAVRRLGSPATIGQLIRSRIHAEQGITCSVGVAASKFVAKLASTRCKPDGLLIVPKEEVLDFLHPLPVGALWGVGEKTEKTLLRHGLNTVGDLAQTPVNTLRRLVGDAAGGQLADLAWGRDPRSVEPHSTEKSLGNEETFAQDTAAPEVIRRELLRLSEKVAARLRAQGYLGRTIGLKLRFADFTTISRSRTLHSGTDVGQEIYATVAALYDALGLAGSMIRLVGVRVEGLQLAEQTPQQLLLDAPDQGWREAEQAVDRATARFGPGAIRPARLLPRDQAANPGRYPAAPPTR